MPYSSIYWSYIVSVVEAFGKFFVQLASHASLKENYSPQVINAVNLITHAANNKNPYDLSKYATEVSYWVSKLSTDFSKLENTGPLLTVLARANGIFSSEIAVILDMLRDDGSSVSHDSTNYSPIVESTLSRMRHSNPDSYFQNHVYAPYIDTPGSAINKRAARLADVVTGIISNVIDEFSQMDYLTLKTRFMDYADIELMYWHKDQILARTTNTYIANPDVMFEHFTAISGLAACMMKERSQWYYMRFRKTFVAPSFDFHTDCVCCEWLIPHCWSADECKNKPKCYRHTAFSRLWCEDKWDLRFTSQMYLVSRNTNTNRVYRHFTDFLFEDNSEYMTVIDYLAMLNGRVAKFGLSKPQHFPDHEDPTKFMPYPNYSFFSEWSFNRVFEQLNVMLRTRNVEWPYSLKAFLALALSGNISLATHFDFKRNTHPPEKSGEFAQAPFPSLLANLFMDKVFFEFRVGHPLLFDDVWTHVLQLLTPHPANYDDEAVQILQRQMERL